MSDSPNLTPILVVSGFLGSGKTTLIRAILTDPRAGEIALIVNEFGEVGIDHHLFRKTDERTTLLRNGCVCCSLRDDLAEVLRDLLSNRERGLIPPFTRVIIETTGLADPVPILQTIVNEPVVRHHYRIEWLVATIDAVAGSANLVAYGEAVRQIAAADQVVITKRDLASDAAIATLKTGIGRINPAASVLEADHGRVSLDVLLGSGARDEGQSLAAWQSHPVEVALPPTMHAAGGRVTSHCLVFDHPLNWPMFGIWLTLLLHRHGDRVLRLKGLLNVGAERGPLLLEGVQHVIHAPRHLPTWPDADHRSRLVFIVRDLDTEEIAASLTSFQAASATV
jgi:G3E family GTPase